MLRILRTAPPHAQGEPQPPKVGELLLVISSAGGYVRCEVVGQTEFVLTGARQGHWVTFLTLPKELRLLGVRAEAGKKPGSEAEEEGGEKGVPAKRPQN